MERVTYAQAQALRDEELAGLPPIRIALLANIVVNPLVAFLRHAVFRMGFQAQCRIGQYDNVLQAALGSEPGLLGSDTDVVLVFLKLETLSWPMARGFPGLTPDQLQAELERVKTYVIDVLAGIRRQTSALILWYGFERPLYPALGIADAQRPEGQLRTIETLNAAIREALHAHAGAYWIDADACLGRVGEKAYYDLRYWHIGKAPYSLAAVREIADEIVKFVRALKGKNKKVLVLDCDNVLWGGTIGEDGLEGIRLGHSYPGSAYREFQQEVVNLDGRGIVLALCSKNNEADVWEVFERHPDMVLQRRHLAAAQINWEDKATNLRRIAAELNLGLDSLVFVDDSDFEANLIRQLLPEVEVLRVPSDTGVEHRSLLASCGWFDTLTLSVEDRERGAAYQAEAERQRLRVASDDLETYYRSLEMVPEIRLADPLTIPRIAQLTQKTNQFNLTTRRYSDEEISRLAASSTADVIWLRLRDRFGDAGIVGVCILRYEDRQAIFDTLLLSCRVLGRGVEDAFMAHCLQRATSRGCDLAVGEYRPTQKNGQVSDFYQRRGFAPLPGEGNGQRFSIGLPAKLEPPGFFARIESELVP